MELVADLHLHSKYSRAVSPQMVIDQIANWARIKGIDLVAAPDWTQPLFFKELSYDLVPAGEGIYKAKNNPQGPSFILATEIASIYSQAGKGHRIHNLVLAPSLETAARINTALSQKGVNLLSDGRPMTGLSSIELCDLVFSVSTDCLIIPCHVWTPWYSLYGSKSGFNSLKECFGRFNSQIYAIETGLSSDSAMNWRIKELDNRAIVSFSDAHSLSKLGRETTVFNLADNQPLTYPAISQAIKNKQIAYTTEFYPEEGKYHWTGHRKCQVRQSPEQTRKAGETCPVCGRSLTLGVMHRVESLATRTEEEVKPETVEMKNKVKGIKWQNRPPYLMLVPLAEILAEALGTGVSSKKVENEYLNLTGKLVSEFNVLLNASLKEISQVSGEKVAQAIDRVRSGQIQIDPGFDGVFGRVKIWPTVQEGLVADKRQQMSLFQ